MSRRARVTPSEAGLPDGGARRRTPGLRREEVAVLAGVGPSWYQWLEQGRAISVSPQVLDSVARVLKMSGTERRHLYVLAGLNPPLPDVGQVPGAGGELRRLIDAWMPRPAHVMDAYWNIVSFNRAAEAAFGFSKGANCLSSFFTDARYYSEANEVAGIAEVIVAYYRSVASAHPGDQGFVSVVEDLAAASTRFAELWARGDVGGSGQMLKEIVHPDVGGLRFETTQLQIPARPDLTIVLHNPCDAGSEKALRRLLAAAGDGEADRSLPCSSAVLAAPRRHCRDRTAGQDTGFARGVRS